MIIVKKDEYEQLFDHAFLEAAEHHSITPDPTASWHRVEQRLKKKKTTFHRLRIFSLVAASFILGAVIFGTPTVTQAVTPFFHSIRNLDSDMISFIFGSKEQKPGIPAKTPAPVEEVLAEQPSTLGSDVPEAASVEEVYHSWNEAASQLAFHPVQMEYIPEGYSLSEVRLFHLNQHAKATEAMAVYFNSSKERLIIKFTQLKGNEVLTSPHYKEGGTFEEIKINNLNAYLYMNQNKRASLEFLNAGLHISINGSLEKEEIIKLAEHIK